MENLEEILSIQCVPMTWPIGDGVNFKGVYDRRTKTILSFSDTNNPLEPTIINAQVLNSQQVLDYIGAELQSQLIEDMEMIEGIIGELVMEEYLAGIQTPVFFGSALNNFGVKETLDMIAAYAPGPAKRVVLPAPYDDSVSPKEIEPEHKKFTGFIFKIQANMDKRHRDRIAFLRICSGKFTRNQKIFHCRSQKFIKIPAPLFFQAQDRELVENAYPGDIIGIYDTGRYQIGDTFSEGEEIQITGIPSFAPEIFMKVELKDPMKAKQLDKGLTQLSEEGTVQLFKRHTVNEKILGAVGMLQFEVVKFRLHDEYGVEAVYANYPFVAMRWIKFPDALSKKSFITNYASNIAYDHKSRVCFAVRSQWDLKLAQEKHPEIDFFMNSDYR